jgi:hypothetical protein
LSFEFWVVRDEAWFRQLGGSWFPQFLKTTQNSKLKTQNLKLKTSWLQDLFDCFENPVSLAQSGFPGFWDVINPKMCP